MEFTKAQKQVINQVDGRVIVIACPGSGKTTTILERTNHMIETGIPPERILVVTFTKAAADEMKGRFEKRYSHKGTIFSTIHSLCFSVLRKHDRLDASNILKEWEAYRFFRELMKDKVPYNDMDTFCKQILSEISYVKNAKLSPADFTSQCHIGSEKVNFQEMFSKYEEFKREHNKIDFDDMLIMCNNIFNKDKQELEYWQDYFPYIIIDEFQDTNIIQSEIFYKLSEKYGNLCIVGDDDQSIYGFRSADSSIMLNFTKLYPDAKAFYLDVNYRSGKKIIKMADKLIANNKVRFQKKFNAAKNDDGTVKRQKFASSEEEIDYVIKRIKDCKAKGIPYEEMAVLYRINKKGIPMISRLTKENIPFHTKEALPDIHKEVFFYDLKTYYKIVQGAGTREDVIKALSHPTRFLKKEDLEKIPKLSKYEMVSYYKRIGKERGRSFAFQIGKIYDFFELIERLKDKSPKDFAALLLDEEYEIWLENYAEYMHRDWENLKTSFDEIKKEAASFKTMDEWFEFADDYANMLKEKNNVSEGVALSTYHGAKGLEWNSVFLLDSDQDVTPYKLAVSDEEIEEERRMFYVAATRAKEELYLLFQKESPFVKEMFSA